ncbi:MAG: U32 family peptidase [Planctomycetota bacterium]|jgi:putative protease|nr:U32 family peptidase [Planctomycetota bacterium]
MELVAPAGDLDCLEAAVEAGADAIYFGLSLLNARRGARNFTPAELIRATELTRKHGVAAYLTVNTDVSGREIGAAARIVSLASDAGVDALVVRDWGVIRLWLALAGEGGRNGRPALHLSTQAAITNPEGVRLAREIGARRLVLARELSLSEIGSLAAVPGLELEIFAQGALCYSVSGRCLMSSWGGGRSGNRGLCASPCRVPWAIDGREVGPAMSMRDLVTLDRLEELGKAGVTALKIEGRLKKPAWVREAVGLYRQALGPRSRPVPPSARIGADDLRRARLLGAYAGRETTSAYLDGKFSGLTGIAARKSDPASREAVEFFLDGRDDPAGYADEPGEDGYSLEIAVADKGLSCRCRFAGRSESWRMPKTRIRREKKAVPVSELFARLAANPIGGVKLADGYSNEPDFLLPPRNVKTVISLVKAFVNRLTGQDDDGVGAVLKAPLPPLLRAALAVSEPHPGNRRRLGERPSQIRLSARQLTPKLTQIFREMEIIVSGASPGDLDRIAAGIDPARLVISFPEVYFPGESPAMRELALACRLRGLRAEANCWGSLNLCRESGLAFVAGPGLAVLNHLAIKNLRERGALGAVISMEGDRWQIGDICRTASLPLSLAIYARPVLAYTRIPRAELLPEGGAGGAWTDRRGISLSPETASSVTLFRSLAPFDWHTLRNDEIRVSHLTLDLAGESSPLEVWRRFLRPGGKPGFLFNYDRGLK